MAAGLGFKTFTTGEVLTAGDVNGYLMQGVLVFASAAARDAAITAPQEGQFAFTKDTNGLWYYDGAVWVASGATGDIEGVTAGVGISGGGTSGTVTITNSMATAIDAKGDLVAGTGADTFSRIAVGANNTVLTADSSTATGLKWAAPGGGFVSAGVYVGTGQSTTSTSFTDLATVQSVTLTTGTKAMITVTCWADNNTVNNRCNISVAVSGATTLAAGADNSIVWRQRSTANTLEFMSGTFYLSGLTAGSNTFTMKFMSPDNTTATFYYRHFIAIDMGS
jgi:hypothetical protein